jgi:hypothetical protein
MNRRERSNRRAFLRAMGAGFATLPCLKLLENSWAQAQGAELPLKFVTIYHPHGLAAEFWATGQGVAGQRGTIQMTEPSFDIAYENCSLQPFDDAATYGKSFKDKIMVIEGLDILSGANGHDTSAAILTGSRVSGKPSNSSLDQFLAVEKKLGAATRLASIALGVGVDTLEITNTLSYGVGGQALPKIIDPVQTYQQLFNGFALAGDPDAQAEAARRNVLGRGVVDFIRGDVNRLRPKLGTAEQMKLDQHLSALDELDKQFETVMSSGGVCDVPTAPSASGFPKLKQYNGGEPYFDAITNAQLDLLAQALACDITRFATVWMNDLAYDGNPLGLPKDNHGSVAHTYSASPVGNDGHGQPGSGDPASWLTLAKFNKYSYSKVARFMQKLDQLGVLDSTIIYVTSDMGNPALHSTRNVPTVLAGGANGKFRMGRRVKLSQDCPPGTGEWCSETQRVDKPNNQLLVSIAQAFGAEIDKFGTQPSEALMSGTLSEIA